jgi:hypothetical protein
LYRTSITINASITISGSILAITSMPASSGN